MRELTRCMPMNGILLMHNMKIVLPNIIALDTKSSMCSYWMLHMNVCICVSPHQTHYQGHFCTGNCTDCIRPYSQRLPMESPQYYTLSMQQWTVMEDGSCRKHGCTHTYSPTPPRMHLIINASPNDASGCLFPSYRHSHLPPLPLPFPYQAHGGGKESSGSRGDDGPSRSGEVLNRPTWHRPPEQSEPLSDGGRWNQGRGRGETGERGVDGTS
jgi:hypothetical protein